MSFLLEWLGLNNLSFNELLWVSFGTLGQLIFFSRWVIQWYYSEKFNNSVVFPPPATALTAIILFFLNLTRCI